MLLLEFFPPKTDAGVENLFEVLQKLKQHNPVFVDFTWGAGGSTSDLTLQLCQRALREHGCNPNMHLTCTNMDISKINLALEGCVDAGITNIFALRGDPPVGQELWTATEAGLSCALDLVKYIREKHGEFFCIGVAGYPEGAAFLSIFLENALMHLQYLNRPSNKNDTSGRWNLEPFALRTNSIQRSS